MSQATFSGARTPGIVGPSGTLPLAQVAGVNLKTTGTTQLYTVPAGKILVVLAVILRCTAAASLSSGPTGSVGVTASSFNDLFASATMTALTAPNALFAFSMAGMSVYATASQVVTLNLTGAATGTSGSAGVDVIGYVF